jgi:hypothetical protein
METYESHLQPDGTTFPPVTPDVPPPPGAEEPVVPDLLLTEPGKEGPPRSGDDG